MLKRNELITKLDICARDNNVKGDPAEFIIVGAYLLKTKSKLEEKGKKDVSFFDLVDYVGTHDLDIRNLILELYNGTVWESMRDIKASDDELNDVILMNVHMNFSKGIAESITSKSISKLTSYILKANNADVANLCSGYGNFFSDYIPLNKSNNNYFGYGLKDNVFVIAKIKNSVLSELYGVNVQYFNSDVLNTEFPLFDRVFVEALLAPKISSSEKANVCRDLNVSKATSIDWIFTLKGLQALKEDGIAVSVMTPGTEFRAPDTAARQQLIDNGMLKAIIHLPRNLYLSTMNNVTMYVFKNDRKMDPVRMIDASTLFVEERRVNAFSNENIKEILQLLDQDDEKYSMKVSRDVIASKDYLLTPARYIQPQLLPKYKNEKRLSELVEIVRGAGYNARRLDEITSVNKETDIKFLTLSNIHDGIIDNDLPYLKTYDPKDQKCLVSNNDLVMSKIGSPIKVAVANFKDDKKVLANGNLYILKIRNESVDPYYLQSLFMSDYGQMLLKTIVRGNSVKTISLKDLNNVMIPLPDMKKQKAIGKISKDMLEEIKEYEHKIKVTQEKLTTVFEKEMNSDA